MAPVLASLAEETKQMVLDGYTKLKNASPSSDHSQGQVKKQNGMSKSASTPHPLDPLSPEELKTAVAILKGHNAQLAEPISALKITGALLVEPSKRTTLKALGIDVKDVGGDALATACEEKAHALPPRRIEICFIDIVTGRCYEAKVNITSRLIEKWTPLEDFVQTSITADELLTCEEVVKADPDIQKLCRDVGIDPNDLRCDGWSIGYEPRLGRGRRLQQGLCWVRSRDHDNLYSRPLDFVALVDSNLGKVVRIDFPDVGSKRGSGGETAEASTVPYSLESERTVSEEKLKHFKEPSKIEKLGPLTRPRITPPAETIEYLPELAKDSSNPITMRTGLKPLHVVQPEGVSFSIDGNHLKWQGWDLHIGWNFREGVYLNTITFQDLFTQEIRPLFHRISLAEMVVPYGEPTWPHPRKHAFDIGEYGLGMMSNSLSLGCDCLGTIHYLDGHYVNTAGQVETLPKCVCIHEEDSGLLYKHTDFRPGGRSHAVRGRKLVISMVCTVANYEYAIYYSLHQDGTIGLEVKLTGVLNLTPAGPNESTLPHGTTVAPGINAHYHQHLFSLRVDPMLDGLSNSVVQTDVKMMEEAAGSEKNFAGNGFYTDRKFFESANNADWDFERSWSMVNENKLHYASHQPVGYKIMCRDMHPMLIKEGAPVWKRAPFARHSFWVVPDMKASDEEGTQRLFPAGKHVPQTVDEPADSISNWVTEGGSVRNEDILCFLTFGTTHIPRPEDFPVMPAETVSVMLKPVGFFRHNPALGIPAIVDKESVPAFQQSGHLNGGGAKMVNRSGENGHHCCSE